MYDKEVHKITLFYMDIYLFVHFICEYMLLKMTQKLLKGKGKDYRLLLGAFFTSAANSIVLISPVPIAMKQLLTYIVITFLEIKICFGFQKVKEYAKAFMLLYVLALFMGGGLDWAFENILILKRHGYSVMTLTAAVFFFACFGRKAVELIKKEILHKKYQKEVHIVINGKTICCQGLLDTGNGLFDPVTGKPVLILERTELAKNQVEIRQEQYRVIPFHSIGKKHGFMEGFVADAVYVISKDVKGNIQSEEKKKVIIGIYEGKLDRDAAYQMILHPML